MIQEDVENEYVKEVDEKKAVNQNIQFDFNFIRHFCSIGVQSLTVDQKDVGSNQGKGYLFNLKNQNSRIIVE